MAFVLKTTLFRIGNMCFCSKSNSMRFEYHSGFHELIGSHIFQFQSNEAFGSVPAAPADESWRSDRRWMGRVPSD